MLCSQLFTPQIPTLISGQVFRYRCPGSVLAASSSWGSSPGTLIQDEGVCLGILTARANAWFQSLFSCLKGRSMSWSGWAEEGVWGETFYSLAYSSVSVVGPGKSQEPGTPSCLPQGGRGPSTGAVICCLQGRQPGCALSLSFPLPRESSLFSWKEARLNCLASNGEAVLVI